MTQRVSVYSALYSDFRPYTATFYTDPPSPSAFGVYIAFFGPLDTFWEHPLDITPQGMHFK